MSNEATPNKLVKKHIQVCRSTHSDPWMWYKNLDGDKFELIWQDEYHYMVFDNDGKFNLIHKEDGIIDG